MSDVNSKLYSRRLVVIDSRNRDNYDSTTMIWSGPGTSYLLGDKVLVNTVGYICTAPHSSSTLFETDIANWSQSNISSSSQYKVRFPVLRNVKMLKLVTVEIPNTQYVVNHKNRFIDFFDSGTGLNYSASVAMGTFTSSTLSDAINLAMNTAMGVGFGVNYSVTYLTSTQQFSITRLGGPTFRLVFLASPHGTLGTNRNLARVIGFTNGKDTSLAVTQRSSNLVNLAGENYCYLVIKGYPTVHSTTNVGDVFAKVIWNQIPRNTVFLMAANAYMFPQSVDQIESFEVSFVEPDGSIYDFNNCDHSFTVEALCE